jgi:hypothetical protein
MSPRDVEEEHRASTPLELFFDLTFVVAVAQASESLHHGLVGGHARDALFAFPLVFFAIWWAWMNFTWFASAYDTDDVPYRIAVFVLMTGVLILAAGVPRAFVDTSFGIITIGYVVMRLAMVALWLRRGAASRGSGVCAPIRHRDRRAADRVGRSPRASRHGRAGRVLLAGHARAVRTSVGGAGRSHRVASRTHRRALRAVHDHRAGRVGAVGDGGCADGDRPRQQVQRSRPGRGRRLAHAVHDVVDLLRSADRAPRRAHSADFEEHLAPRSRGLRPLLRVRVDRATGAGLVVAIDQLAGHSELTDVQAALRIHLPVSLYVLSVWALHARYKAGTAVRSYAPPAAIALILLSTFTSEPVLVTGLVMVGLVALNVVSADRALIRGSGSPR